MKPGRDVLFIEGGAVGSKDRSRWFRVAAADRCASTGVVDEGSVVRGAASVDLVEGGGADNKNALVSVCSASPGEMTSQGRCFWRAGGRAPA